MAKVKKSMNTKGRQGTKPGRDRHKPGGKMGGKPNPRRPMGKPGKMSGKPKTPGRTPDQQGWKGGKPKFNGNSYKSKQRKESESDFEEVDQERTTKAAPDIDGFPGAEMDAASELKATRKLVQQQNRKKKKSGGFQSMGLSHHVFKGVMRKGYKIPTPIQRKTIPLIIDGKDVVAMARTGSGKTAAFLIPMFEKLKTRLTSGARALILAPTRELALQTLKFTKELGRFTRLKCAVVLGGDSLEEQFASIHENPDILIATPGRFMHLLVEMELKLSSVEYVVFDEADRLFELGFASQLHEVLARLPETRQTVLFSATLPKLLVEFAKAGLHDPTLIRLDVDSKLSENLKLAFLQCKSDSKPAVLLHLLRTVVKPSQQTVVFVATKHHVEYLYQILSESGFDVSYTYSALDQTARKINVAKFRARKTRVLIVTDLAARGIDIPLLDNVINYNFPAKSKLFVHRVGRVARAGQSGTAYSLLATDEMPFVLDLHMFLGRPLKYVEVGKTYTDTDGMLGLVPQTVVDEEDENLREILKLESIESQKKTVHNGYKHYVRSRPTPSSESVKRVKETAQEKIGYHPLFGSVSSELEEERANLLQSMRQFKPRGTIFEINTSKKTDAFSVMKTKRQHHSGVIERNLIKQHERDEALTAAADRHAMTPADDVDMDTVNDAFVHVVAPKPTQETKMFEDKKKKKAKKFLKSSKDDEFYVSYQPKDFKSEQGLSMGTSFDKEAAGASLDITGDDAQEIHRQKKQIKWDRKRKKYIAETGIEPGKKKIKTESGQWISATYKKNIYKDWLEKSKVMDKDDDDDDTTETRTPGGFRGRGRGRGRGGPGRGSQSRGDSKPGGFKGRKEMKPKEQILKERRKKERLRSFMKKNESARKRSKGKK